MNTLAPQRLPQCAALLLLAFAAVLFAALAIWPFQLAARARETAADKLVTLQRLQLAEKRLLDEQQPDTPEIEAALLKNFLSGATEPVASAALQTDLRDLIIRVGGQVNGAQSLSSEATINRLGARLQLEISLQGLVDVLQQLESRVPILAVDQVRINSPFDRTSASARLNVTMDVSGAYLKNPERK